MLLDYSQAHYIYIHIYIALIYDLCPFEYITEFHTNVVSNFKFFFNF